MRINVGALSEVATLQTHRLRLEPQSTVHFHGVWSMLHNEEGRRLTGTHTTFTEEQTRLHLEKLPLRHDRADWAIISTADEAYLGEVVLNDLDADNESMNLRIALGGNFGRGYGTEAVRAAVAYGFDQVRLHRIGLEVFAFNRRAQRVYEKCGFTREGVARDALVWNSERLDAVQMSILATDPRPVE